MCVNEKNIGLRDFLYRPGYNAAAMARAEFILDQLRVIGSSYAGEETWLGLPELNVGFDIGRAPRDIIPIEHIFLTHGHMDHAAGLAYYFAQRWFVDAAPGNLYVAPSLIDPIRRLLRVWGEIDGHEPPANLHPAVPGRDLAVRRDLIVRPFEVSHFGAKTQRAALSQALGYCVIEVRQKLKDEFAGLSGPQIVEKKQAGIEITRRVEVPLVAFCGDTGPGPFLDLDYVRTARILLLECTFFDPDDLRRSRAGGHMHISDLKAALPQLSNERILITHLTRRMMLSEAKAILRQELGHECDGRVSLLMEHHRRNLRPPRPSAPDAGADRQP
jgi:ribonuclease Z